MDNNLASEPNKKVILEDLSKEELLKKCKGLLVLAQKAKQTKDSLQEENNLLKTQLKNKTLTVQNASEEIIENLTQQKLALVTTIEELKSKNSSLDSKLQIYEKELCVAQEKLDVVDNENTSYKRQLTRLTDENEQLISHLEALEKQIDELNKIGIQQREQLLILEKSKLELNNVEDNNKIIELQNMLGVSLEEIKKLKTEHSTASEKIESLEINLSEKNKTILSINEELQSSHKELEELKKKYHTLKQMLNSSNQKIEEENEKLIEDTKNENDRLKEKLKLYHSKLVKFAGNVKAVKEEKNQILQLFKSYTDQVKEWKEQLNSTGKNLVKLVNEFEEENEQLKKDLFEKNSQLQDIKEENDNLTKQLNSISCSDEISRGKIEVLTQEKEIIASRLQEIVTKYDNETKILIDRNEKENVELKNKLKDSEATNLNLIKDAKDLQAFNSELKTQIDSLNEEMKALKILNKDLQGTISENQLKIHGNEEELKELHRMKQNELLKLQQTVDELRKELQNSKTTEKQLAEKSSEEILKLLQENKEMSDVIHTLENKLENMNKKIDFKDFATQTEEDCSQSSDVKDQISSLKRENTELLTEMNEMNQVLKERGETISKLEAHREEVMKKLQIYETQANKNVDNITEKEEIIKNLTDEIKTLKSKNIDVNSNPEMLKKDEEINNLKSEIENLKEKTSFSIDAGYAESETMSTSTMSRTDEVNRLKDLEGSWEEKYSKLRNLAIKLKGKIREQTVAISNCNAEKEHLHRELTESVRTVKFFQYQADELEDRLDATKLESSSYLKQLSTAAEEISKNKKLLAANDETMVAMRKEIEELKVEKESREEWKKKISLKVQALRKEVEANNLLKKDFESKISKLNSDLEAKEKALKAEMECHKQTKSLLEQSNSECKKNSVLNLEMQDYERSVKELSQQLEKKNEQISSLQSQIDSQKSTVSALREQNKLLEERIESEHSDLNVASSELNSYKKKINSLEETIKLKEEKITSLTQLLENTRFENEELSTELSKIIAEHQKSINSLKSERDHFRSQTAGLQQNLREAQDSLKLREDELKVIKNDYEGYKVRAQSVLRQNNNRDVGLEEKLSEEVATIKAQNNSILNELSELKEISEGLEIKNKKLSSEKEEFVHKCQEFESEVEELKSQYAQLSSKHQQALNDHAETVRSLKIHADTLSQCYRQQISEQEVRHNREIIELQSRLEKAPSPSEPPPIHLSMPREEGEGSESVESNPSPSVHPVPLERLLGSDSDQEVAYMKKQLAEQESKVAYLTDLLADTEQDLAKHVQMNKLLKEEIRRQQRSVEREKHAENLEYLKNVIFKFVTLNSGDERSRLVPVLNTILKLSPEEIQKLNMVAKGDPGLRGWTNYLPLWPSPNKPQ